jgi:hypothetical protein
MPSRPQSHRSGETHHDYHEHSPKIPLTLPAAFLRQIMHLFSASERLLARMRG